MKTKEKLQSILSALNTGVYEKNEVIALSLLAATAGESIFLLGAPGTAKSLAARRLKFAFKDAKHFEYLMSRFSTPDEIFGPVSIQKLKEDHYERLVKNYLPDADIVFLDEIWKAGPSIQNSLLTVINEKVFRNGEQEIKVPMKALIAASNELPAKNEGLEALWDRFLVRLVVEGIEQQQNFNAMISEKINSYEDNVDATLKITTEEYAQWSKDIDDVEVPENVFNVIDVIRKKVQAHNDKNADNQMYVSDRRWRKIVRLLRTSAFLNDRRAVDLMDCFLIKKCIWNDEQQIKIAAEIVDEVIRQHGYKLSIDFSALKEELEEMKQEIWSETHKDVDTRRIAIKKSRIDTFTYRYGYDKDTRKQHIIYNFFDDDNYDVQYENNEEFTYHNTQVYYPLKYLLKLKNGNEIEETYYILPNDYQKLTLNVKQKINLYQLNTNLNIINHQSVIIKKIEEHDYGSYGSERFLIDNREFNLLVRKNNKNILARHILTVDKYSSLNKCIHIINIQDIDRDIQYRDDITAIVARHEDRIVKTLIYDESIILYHLIKTHGRAFILSTDFNNLTNISQKRDLYKDNISCYGIRKETHYFRQGNSKYSLFLDDEEKFLITEEHGARTQSIIKPSMEKEYEWNNKLSEYMKIVTANKMDLNNILNTNGNYDSGNLFVDIKRNAINSLKLKETIKNLDLLELEIRAIQNSYQQIQEVSKIITGKLSFMDMQDCFEKSQFNFQEIKERINKSRYYEYEVDSDFILNKQHELFNRYETTNFEVLKNAIEEKLKNQPLF